MRRTSNPGYDDPSKISSIKKTHYVKEKFGDQKNGWINVELKVEYRGGMNLARIAGTDETISGKKVGEPEEKSLLLYRYMKINGGWLVKDSETYACYEGGGIGVGLTFIPDPNHENEPLPVE